MQSILIKLKDHIKRRKNARRFQIPFRTRANFSVPCSILIGSAKHHFARLDDPGCKEDFLACFIEDVYGLASITPPISRILDIGGNVGFFSLAARSYFPNAIIHCYEPNPRVLNEARQNAKTANFEVYAEAVSDKIGHVSILDNSDSNLTTTAPGGSIPSVPLSSAIERIGGQVDLLKLDCEGAEWAILQTHHNWDPIVRLRMEYHLWANPQSSITHMIELINKTGLRVTKLIESGQFGILWADRRHE